MKTIKTLTAALLLLATLVSCAPSAKPSVEPSVPASTEPTVAPTPTPSTEPDMNYYRYTGASSFYPLWAQPNSEYVCEETRYGTERSFTVGGYLTREEVEGREDIAEFGLYSTDASLFAAKNTKAVYDETGWLSEILYLYADGEYRAEPPSGDDVPTLPEETPNVYIPGGYGIAVLPRSEDDINLSYEEYFSEPRQAAVSWYESAITIDEVRRGWIIAWAERNKVDWYKPLLTSGTVKSQYTVGGAYSDDCVIYYTDGVGIYARAVRGEETETIYTAEAGEILSIGGDDAVLFFMTSDYEIYRLHVPSGTVDFMCDTAFDFEAAQEGYREYIKELCWRYRANLPEWMLEEGMMTEEEFFAEQQRLEQLTYEEWEEEQRINDTQEWLNSNNDYLPDCGSFEVLSNNDVRFTVFAPDWQPIFADVHDWFSHIIYGTGWAFYGDYVTYSAALGKYGATDRALDLLGIPEEQRMTFEEFCDYYGGFPPHSDI